MSQAKPTKSGSTGLPHKHEVVTKYLADSNARGLFYIKLHACTSCPWKTAVDYLTASQVNEIRERKRG